MHRLLFAVLTLVALNLSAYTVPSRVTIFNISQKITDRLVIRVSGDRFRMMTENSLDSVTCSKDEFAQIAQAFRKSQAMIRAAKENTPNGEVARILARVSAPEGIELSVGFVYSPDTKNPAVCMFSFSPLAGGSRNTYHISETNLPKLIEAISHVEDLVRTAAAQEAIAIAARQKERPGSYTVPYRTDLFDIKNKTADRLIIRVSGNQFKIRTENGREYFTLDKSQFVEFQEALQRTAKCAAATRKEKRDLSKNSRIQLVLPVEGDRSVILFVVGNPEATLVWSCLALQSAKDPNTQKSPQATYLILDQDLPDLIASISDIDALRKAAGVKESITLKLKATE